MKKNDLEKYVKKNYIKASDKDINTVYEYMKKYCNVFFDNPIFYISKLKDNISNETYDLILSLYEEYKKYL